MTKKRITKTKEPGPGPLFNTDLINGTFKDQTPPESAPKRPRARKSKEVDQTPVPVTDVPTPAKRGRKPGMKTKTAELPTVTEPPVEIDYDITGFVDDIETVKPLIIDETVSGLIGGTQNMYRAPFGGGGGGRFYFREGFPDFYAGYSLWTKSVLPTSQHLIQWKVDNGEQGELISLTSREYGSIFHITVARHENPNDEFVFKFRGPLAADWVDMINDTVAHFGLPKMYIETWRSQLKNDMFAYFRWKREHQVKVLAVECPLWDDKFKIATPVDMVVSCLVKKSPYAKVPTEPAIVGVDFKTGDGSVDYDEYKLQLEFIRYAWNKRFGRTKYKMTHIYNWNPKKRNMSVGGFNFTNQDGKFTKAEFLHLAKTCAVMGYNRPSGKMLTYIDGERDIDASVENLDPYKFLKAFFKPTTII